MKVLIIGDSCTDVFVYGDCTRLSPEAPVPVLEPRQVVENAGMAGNVYKNLLSLMGGGVDILTNTQEVTKTRYVDIKTNIPIVRVDQNDNITERVDLSQVDISSYNVVMVIDYNKGFLHTEDIIEIGKKAKLSYIDTKKYKHTEFFDYYDFVKMNEVEWEACQKFGADYDHLREKLIITRSQKGCEFDGQLYSVDNSVEVRDVSGAGDTWSSSFIYQILMSNDVGEAIKYANKAATIVVQKRGVSVINKKDIENEYS